MNYKLSCVKINEQHAEFDLFDRGAHGTPANCGRLVLPTEDLLFFLQRCWRGDIFWNGLLTPELDARITKTAEKP